MTGDAAGVGCDGVGDGGSFFRKEEVLPDFGDGVVGDVGNRTLPAAF